MDESEQEKIRRESTGNIAKLSAEIYSWFRETHDALLKWETELDLMIRLNTATTEPELSIKALSTTIKVIVHNIGVAFDLFNAHFKESDSHFEEIIKVNDRIVNLRKDLEANRSSTEIALTAINRFVEHYKPMLEELENERQFKYNVGRQ